jgi:hypothetical protein
MCSKSLPDLGEQARAIACRQHDACLASETCANIECEAEFIASDRGPEFRGTVAISVKRT